MKAGFALNITDSGVGLLHRTPGGWEVVGETRFDDPRLKERLGILRTTAAAMSPGGVQTKLVLPNSEILYTTLRAPGPGPAARRMQIRKGLEGLTPYAVDELVFDWSGTGETVKVAVIARETLEQAESFAIEHRLNAVSFVGNPAEGTFAGEPFFGMTSNARSHMPRGQDVERDSEPVSILPGSVAAVAQDAAPGAGAVVESGAEASVAAASADSTPVAEPVGEAAADADSGPAGVDADHTPAGARDSAVSVPGAVDGAAEPASGDGIAATAVHPEGQDLPVAELSPKVEMPGPLFPELSDGTLDGGVDGGLSGGPDDGVSAQAAGDAPGPAPDFSDADPATDMADAAKPADVPEAGMVIDAQDDLPAAPPDDLHHDGSDGDAPSDGTPAGVTEAPFSSRRSGEPGAIAAAGIDSIVSRLGQTGHPADFARGRDLSDDRNGKRGKGKTAKTRAESGSSMIGAALPADARGAGQGGPALNGAVKPGSGAHKRVDAPAAAAANAARKAERRGSAAGAGLGKQRTPLTVGGKPRHLGIVLTVVLLTALAVAALVSSYLVPNEPSVDNLLGTTPAGDSAADGAGSADQPLAEDGATDGGEVPAVEDEALFDGELPESLPAAETEAAPEGEGEGAAEPDTGPEDGAGEATALPDTLAAAPGADADGARVSSSGTSVADGAPADPIAAALAEAVASDPAMSDPAMSGSALGEAGPAEEADLAPPASVVATAPDLARAPGQEGLGSLVVSSVDPDVIVDPTRPLTADAPADRVIAEPQPAAPQPAAAQPAEPQSAALQPAATPPSGTAAAGGAAVPLVAATVEGTLSPDGILIRAGQPAVVPPARPQAILAAASAAAPPGADSAAAPGTAPADPALQQFRPRARPAGLVPDAAPAAPAPALPLTEGAVDPAVPAGGADAALAAAAPAAPLPDTGESVAGQSVAGQSVAGQPGTPPAAAAPTGPLPRARPAAVLAAAKAEVAARAAAAEAMANASPQAVAISRVPVARPRIVRPADPEVESAAIDAAVAVAAAESAASDVAVAERQPADEPVREAAIDPAELDEPEPTSAAPAIPTRASVAKQATLTNALNLSKVNLIGVYGSSSSRRALVRLSNGRYQKVQVGDRFDGGKIAAIGEGELSYVKNGRTIVLKLLRDS